MKNDYGFILAVPAAHVKRPGLATAPEPCATVSVRMRISITSFLRTTARCLPFWLPASLTVCMAACAGHADGAPEQSTVLAGVEAQSEADDRAFRKFFDGEMKLRMGDIRGAESDFEDAAKFDPGSAEVQLRLSQIHQLKGELPEAEAFAREAVRLDVKNVGARLKYAQLLTARGALGDAVKQLDAALEVEPENISALLQKGSVETTLGRMDDATKTFRKVLDIEPLHTVALFSLAQIAASQGKYPQAEDLYLQTIEIAPRFKRAYIDLFLIYEQYGEKKKALDILRRLVEEVDPDNEELRRLYSSALINQGELDTAVKVLEKERDSQPGNLDVLARLGYAHFEQKNFEAAIEEFRLVLARDAANDAVRYYLAISLDNTGQPEASIVEFSRIKTESPVFPEALLYQAFVLEKLDRKGAAIDAVSKALALKPEEPRFPEYLAALYLRAKRIDDGIKVARDGLDKFPKAIRLHVVLGYLLEKKDFDESIRTMQRVLDLDPKNAEALNFIGYGWADRGIRLPDAEKMIRLALEAQPDDGNITDSLGWVLFKQGKFTEALKVLKRAVEMSPGVAEIRDHLGDAYKSTGDQEKAVETWRQALELNPDPELKTSIEKKLRDNPAAGTEPPKKAGKKAKK